MQLEDALSKAALLLSEADAAYLTTINAQGMPVTRAMFNLHAPAQFPSLVPFFTEQDDKWVRYFTTNTSSRKVAQLREHPMVSVYYSQPAAFHGLCLGGTLELVEEMAIKRALWQPNWTGYYPGGVEDPDYAILRLTPLFGELYYQGMARWTFPLKDTHDYTA